MFVGAESGAISALRSQDGALLWQHTVHDAVPYPPLRTDSQAIYFGSSHGIYAHSTQDGSLLWQFATPRCRDFTNAVAAISEGVVYAFLDGLYVLQASDGALLWHDTRFYLTPAYLVVRSGKVYIPSNEQDHLHVLRASDGSPLNILGGRNMIASDTMLYISSQSRGLYAVDSKDDRLAWINPNVTIKITAAGSGTIYSLASVIKSPSTLDAATPHSTETDQGLLRSTSVYALHASDGSQKWSWSIPYAGGISSHPLVIEGNIYFSAIGGMYALRGGDGTQLWNALSDKLLSSDPVAG